MARLPPPKNIIATPKTGVITPEWLDWLLTLADDLEVISPPGPGEGGGGAGGGAGSEADPGSALTIINNYGSGTPSYITKWLAPQTLGDSIISESGATVTINGTLITSILIAQTILGTLPLHAPTHARDGTDPLRLDLLAPPEDTLDLNASTSTHGLLPRLSGEANEFLNGEGKWVALLTDGGSGGGEGEGEEGGGTGGGGLDNEVSVGWDMPAWDSGVELWYDTQSIPEGGTEPGVLKVLVNGWWQPVHVEEDQLTLPTERLLGRGTIVAGPPEEILLGSGLRMTGTTLSAEAAVTSAWSYTFNQTIVEPPTGNQIRFNAAFATNYAGVTKVWIRDITNDGVDMRAALLLQPTGSRLYLQDKDDHARHVRFDTTGEPVGKTDYVEFTVSWFSDGGIELPAQMVEVVFAGGTSGGGGGGMNLDYLGTYVPGPVYNDGDIVVGPDNIAYMCVVDGTTTPPEPWPGVGVASAMGPPGTPGAKGDKGDKGDPGTDAAIVADATYWTVSAHPTLVNERALNTLATGYVKSTAGEPSTVAVIPVAEGGTGATNATQARTNLGVGNVGTANYNGSAAYFLRGDGVWAIPPQPVGVPSGMIGMFATACPAGWTRLGGWDGRMPRAMPSYGNYGGSTNHYHPAGSLTLPAHGHGHNLSTADHTHGFSWSANTDYQGTHSHSFGIHQTTQLSNQGTMNADAGSDGFVARGDHNHNMDVEGRTGDDGNHRHFASYSGNTGGHSTAGINGGVSGAPAIGIVNNTDWATDHYPPFFDVVMCVKD